MKFQCPYCDTLLEADKGSLGKQIKCPDCGGLILVPRPDGAPAIKQGSERPAEPSLNKDIENLVKNLQEQISAKNKQLEESINQLKKQAESYDAARKKDQNQITNLLSEVRELTIDKDDRFVESEIPATAKFLDSDEFELVAPPRTVSSQIRQRNLSGSSGNARRQYAGIPSQQTPATRGVPRSASLAPVTEPLPVLDAFQKFIETERKRARNRMIVLSVFLTVVSLGLIGGAIFVGTFFLNRVAGDIDSVKGVISSAKIDSEEIEKNVDLTMGIVRSESGRMMEDIDRRKQSLESMESDFNEKLRTIEKMNKTITRLEVENMRLMDEMKKMRDNLPASFAGDLDALAKQIKNLSEARREEKRESNIPVLVPDVLPAVENEPEKADIPSESIRVSVPDDGEDEDPSTEFILPLP